MARPRSFRYARSRPRGGIPVPTMNQASFEARYGRALGSAQTLQRRPLTDVGMRPVATANLPESSPTTCRSSLRDRSVKNMWTGNRSVKNAPQEKFCQPISVGRTRTVATRARDGSRFAIQRLRSVTRVSLASVPAAPAPGAEHRRERAVAGIAALSSALATFSSDPRPHTWSRPPRALRERLLYLACGRSLHG
jgi:hypothetical protein